MTVTTDDLWWYRASPVRAVDGDTVEVVVDLGMDVHTTQPLRLLNVWAPERNAPGGTDATNEAAGWLAKRSGKWPLVIHTIKDRRTFNRYVADVYDVATGEHLNDYLRHYLISHTNN